MFGHFGITWDVVWEREEREINLGKSRFGRISDGAWGAYK